VFPLPDLGEGLHDAEIVAWHVGVGDHVVVDQPLVSVETDQAVVEVPSPRAGRVAALHGAPGDVVGVGAPLVEFDAAPAADTGAIVGTLAGAVPPPAGGRTRRRPRGARRQRARRRCHARRRRDGVCRHARCTAASTSRSRWTRATACSRPCGATPAAVAPTRCAATSTH
jgi:pyruvate/2-oxoglutarate dehydrogenase complex dihydrolipoamide acyltransferase (E2) component